MAICSYCDTDVQTALTREHVLPAFLNKHAKGRQTFSAKAMKIFGGDITVKDVCATCNNGALSALDALALGSLEPYFGVWCREDEPCFALDGHAEDLTRWALKVVFNMARSTGAPDLAALQDCRHYILTGKRAPRGLTLFAGIVRSYRFSAEERAAITADLEWLDPGMHRISLWNDPKVQRMASFARVLFIDAIAFLVVKRKRTASTFALTSLVDRTLGLRPVAMSETRLVLRPSKIDVASSYQHSIAKHIDVYGSHFSDETRDQIRENAGLWPQAEAPE